MSYTPEQGLAVALFNSGRFERLQEAFDLAEQTLPRLHQMGFDVTDFGHSSMLPPPAEARRQSPHEPILDALTTEEVAADLGVQLPMPPMGSPEAVQKARANGCEPKQVWEMGEWSWWACTCDDRRHANDNDSYFQGRWIT